MYFTPIKRRNKVQHVLAGAVIFLVCMNGILYSQNPSKKTARELGIVCGIFSPGIQNAITDVKGVRVGHVTLCRGNSVRTGVTAVLPHNGNLFKEKVPGAVYVANGFGKLAGSTQVNELGTIETPVILTNTLSVGTAVSAVVRYMLSLSGNEKVRSVNALVGETNDGWLNSIREFNVSGDDVRKAIISSKRTNVLQGCVGAGTGTKCLGFKGGIGTASRVLPQEMGGWTVGVLVQTNFSGILSINGAPVGRELGSYSYHNYLPESEEGSCMIIVATDAPLLHRNLKRLAARSVLGIGLCGGYCSNGSGDYAIAFSVNDTCRIISDDTAGIQYCTEVQNRRMSPLFMAVVEATQEAILNSMFTAETVRGRDGHIVYALPADKVVSVCAEYNSLNWDTKLPHKHKGTYK